MTAVSPTASPAARSSPVPFPITEPTARSSPIHSPIIEPTGRSSPVPFSATPLVLGPMLATGSGVFPSEAPSETIDQPPPRVLAEPDSAVSHLRPRRAVPFNSIGDPLRADQKKTAVSCDCIFFARHPVQWAPVAGSAVGAAATGVALLGGLNLLAGLAACATVSNVISYFGMGCLIPQKELADNVALVGAEASQVDGEASKVTAGAGDDG